MNDDRNLAPDVKFIKAQGYEFVREQNTDLYRNSQLAHNYDLAMNTPAALHMYQVFAHALRPVKHYCSKDSNPNHYLCHCRADEINAILAKRRLENGLD